MSDVVASHTSRKDDEWFEALSRHWSEYLMEAAGLASFMISACAVRQ
ncbi:MAG: hypothetical protein M5R38_09195 [Candidatus Methylomirabilis sp.]|nr:hypothetical protein [Candidatus Methylomirabilis sp.]